MVANRKNEHFSITGTELLVSSEAREYDWSEEVKEAYGSKGDSLHSEIRENDDNGLPNSNAD
jgi:hypothetical protein